MASVGASVVVPMYNAARYLRETVESVLAQTYEAWELVLVDDGSTDETPSIARSFLADERVRYLRIENSGVSVARNTGFAATSGEFVAFLDADDVWLPQNLALKVGYLQSNPGVGLVHGDVQIIDEAARPTGVIQRGREGHLLEPLLLWDSTSIPAPSNVLLRRSLLERHGGFDPQLSTAADQDLYFRLAPHTRIGRLSGVLTRYRIHKSAMHLNIHLMERDHIATYLKAERLGLFRDARFKRRCFSNLYLILSGSWWHEGRNKGRALRFVFKALATYPPSLAKVARKAWRAAARRPPPGSSRGD